MIEEPKQSEVNSPTQSHNGGEENESDSGCHDTLNILGSFIREQRRVAKLSLRKLSDVAQVSNPYLSQIERGLRKPSAQVLQQIASGLRISAESLYIQAGILTERPKGTDLVDSIMSESTITASQKRALVQVLRSFQLENSPHRASDFAEKGATEFQSEEMSQNARDAK